MGRSLFVNKSLWVVFGRVRPIKADTGRFRSEINHKAETNQAHTADWVRECDNGGRGEDSQRHQGTDTHHHSRAGSHFCARGTIDSFHA
jgi:hypothetical protein